MQIDHRGPDGRNWILVFQDPNWPAHNKIG